MFFELKDGSLVNLNQAWKISMLSYNQVIAENAETYVVLYEGSPSECQAFLDKLKSSLPVHPDETDEMDRFFDKADALVADFKSFMDKLEKAK